MEARGEDSSGASTRVRESFKSENPEPVVPEKPEMAPLPKPTCSAVQRSVWTDLSEDENKELWELISSFCATYGKDVELISKAAVNEPYQLTEEDYSVLRSACEMLGFKISEKKRADEALLSYLKIPIEKIEKPETAHTSGSQQNDVRMPWFLFFCFDDLRANKKVNPEGKRISLWAYGACVFFLSKSWYHK